jgi:extradiol dioxygenase family protein
VVSQREPERAQPRSSCGICTDVDESGNRRWFCRSAPQLRTVYARAEDFLVTGLAMTLNRLPRFHLAFPVSDLSAARRFYGGLLACPEGRSSANWVDFDFYGHQIVAHLSEQTGEAPRNEVDGESVPVRHFGVILTKADWLGVTQKLKAAQIKFIIEPQVRFAGQVGEQATCFFLDPSGNAIELKSFADDAMVFAK